MRRFLPVFLLFLLLTGCGGEKVSSEVSPSPEVSAAASSKVESQTPEESGSAPAETPSQEPAPSASPSMSAVPTETPVPSPSESAQPTPVETPAPSQSAPVSAEMPSSGQTASADAILPNTALFLGKSGSKTGPDNYRRLKAGKLDYATFSVAEKELLELMGNSRYQLTLVGEELLEDDESFHDKAYYYLYTGTNADVDYLVKDGQTLTYHVKLLFEHFKKVDELNVTLYYSEAFTLEDTGKTSSAVGGGSSSGGSESGEKDCWYCGGSGKCPTCHGSGSVRNWVPGTTDYMSQSCTDCYSPGKCRMCGGSGRE